MTGSIELVVHSIFTVILLASTIAGHGCRYTTNRRFVQFVYGHRQHRHGSRHLLTIRRSSDDGGCKEIGVLRTRGIIAAFAIGESSLTRRRFLRQQLQRHHSTGDGTPPTVATQTFITTNMIEQQKKRKTTTTMMMMSTENRSNKDTIKSSPSQDNNRLNDYDNSKKSQSKSEYKPLYPPFPSFVRNGTIQLDDIHTLYYEEYGNTTTATSSSPKAETTALFLHGGPGASSNPNHARFFDPQKYTRIILYDQRGCGKSTPKGEIRQNTLSNLVQDIEILRQNLNVSRWEVILGGSWGVTLALAYAQYFPEKVGSLVLRGIFCLRPEEIYWLFGRARISRDVMVEGGNTASKLFQEQWENFEYAVLPKKMDNNNENNEKEEQITENDGWDVLYAYYDRLLGDDPLVRLNAAKSWFTWEMGVYSRSSSKTSSAQDAKNQTNNRTSNSADTINTTSAANTSYPLLSYNKEWGWSFKGEEKNTGDNDDRAYEKEDIENMVNNLRKWSKPYTGGDDDKQHFSSHGSAPFTIRQVKPINYTSPSEIKITKTQNTSNKTAPTQQQLQQFIPAQAVLTCFYSVNALYMMQNYSLFTSSISPNHDHVQKMFQSIPCIAIQGGNDLICPPDTVLDLHQIWPEMEVRIPFKSGHSMYDDAITSEIVKATDWFAKRSNRKNEEDILTTKEAD